MRRPSDYLAALGRYLLSVRHGEQARYRHARAATAGLYRSPEAIAADQLRRVREIIDRAYHHSPFNRQRFVNIGLVPADIASLADVARLPELTKTDLRDHASEMLCDDLAPEDITHALTGGTTGIPVRFYRDRECVAFRRGLDLAIFRYYGWRDGQWMGWLWGATRDLVFPRNLKTRLARSLAYRTYYFDATRIDNPAYEHFVRQTNRRRPPLVSAYPSLAFDLAERIEAGEVSPVQMPAISVTAEPLYEFQRTKIESALRTSVYARYGTREFGPAAFECPEKNGLHIITDSVYVEIEPFEPDQPNRGAILATDLMNRAMPLIRYRTGDVGELDPTPCPCGLALPRLCRIEGREADVIWRPDGSGVSGAWITTVVGESTLRARIQIIQDKLNELTLRIEGRLENHKTDVEELVKIFRRKIGDDFTFRIEAVEAIDRAESGKYRYVISNISRPRRGNTRAEQQ